MLSIQWLFLAIESFVKIVDSIVWPVTVLLIAMLFRKELREVLARLSHLRYGEVEARFSKELESAESTIPTIPKISQSEASSKVSQISPPDSDPDQLNLLAQVSPRAAIIEGWSYVEQGIFELFRELNVPGHKNKPTHLLINKISALGIVSEGLLSTINSLRRLRNEAVHVSDSVISYGDAERFIKLVKQTTWSLTSESLEARLKYLKHIGIEDPNIDMFIASITGDLDMLKIALEAGVDVNITDTSLLSRYKEELAGFSLESFSSRA